MGDRSLLKLATKVVIQLDKSIDKITPEELAQIIKSHSKIAAITAFLISWMPLIGSGVSLLICAILIWSMYYKINKGLGISFMGNKLKSILAGIGTNLFVYAIASLFVSTILSIFPGPGSLGSEIISVITCYALTLISGRMYMEALIRIL